MKSNQGNSNGGRKGRGHPRVSFDCGILSEPLISFGGGHTHVDPKTGLSLYGPYTTKGADEPTLSKITVGVVGPKDMIGDAQQWLEACTGMLTNEGANPYANPHFPGIDKDGVFQCRLSYGETWYEVIKQSEITHALRGNYHERLNSIIKLYVESVGVLSQRDPKPDVILACIPQEIIELCTVRVGADGREERIKLSKGEKQNLKIAQSGQTFLWDDLNPLTKVQAKVYDHQNLRRGIKAEAMRHGIPTQIVWPRTLNLNPSASTKRELSSQDSATKAWNFITGLYYKAGGTPWRLQEMDSNVCFVGISFYRDIHEENRKMHSSMAQSFTSAGDGYVLRGKTFEWDDSKDRAPHLDRGSAYILMKQVIQLYKQQNKGSLPNRIVLHKTSKFWEEELLGLQEACQDIPQTDFVAFGYRKIQFYRPGNYPPLRGTYIKITNSNLLIYTVGYVHYYKTYSGPRIPNPIEVIEHIGDSPWKKVLEEILALTKMNWNTASFSCSQPITIAFSKKVGEVLAELPKDIQHIKAEYRYYM